MHLPRVEPVGRRERARRTGVEAGPALSAMVGFRRVGLEVEVGEDRAQKQPGAEFARHQIGVLALPAEPGARRERLLHERRGVDEHFHVRFFRPRRSDQE